MIQSMTGFGKHVVQLPNKKITVEIKSLNSKSIDLNARMPSSYREKELELRKLVANSLLRGKVDFNLYVELTGNETSTQVNEIAVKQYMNQLKNIASGDDLRLLEMALRFPDAMKTDKEDIDEEEYKAIKEALIGALKEINEFRSEEGSVLEKDFLDRIASLEKLLEEVIAIDPDRQATIRERLEKAVQDIKADVDANRFEQELIYYLEKYDITEEKVRLANHLDYFSKTLRSNDSNGKKLGFISQEIGREINTIGSKANFAPMQQLVVQMKDELEKIKEQMLNVL
ncbi:MAG: YicC/YloC family endoribonuclease [Maribacter dokdonensis]|uniref:TIGR00255 family protein n=1 Tax=Maribacter dokdonensis TaxID=320912 RepID=A0ABY0UW54_9FLAO|nr:MULTISPECIES: YicC/YloC family endoribonuclease [Maribacter]HAF76080.1 YicC family protein [Maribacter sp.]MDP2526530.1 YicC/YloC family endoribonuclease [Maribacter dokdonensis]PHN94776.1 YicC family protein [Maribacter sp. 6B07]CAG2531638.1 TIGR00255 family protein [Maribacter dokdonensis]SDT26530.1 TIGR00255 family protein [Maribacter dokdonensis]|tara:strand:+ start:923 stop:1780 length:858 start_codon:yes stop_codon:yes gene_type:complete